MQIFISIRYNSSLGMKIRCPECGGEMSWEGYRPLFATCTECGESFHVDECEVSGE